MQISRSFPFIAIYLLLTCSIQAQIIDWNTVKIEVQNAFDSSTSTGASIIIVNSDTTLFYEGFGFADLEHKRAVTKSTLFPVGSITKTFTALAILKLVEQGHFDLGDPISSLIPELPISNHWEKDFPIKVYHLLEHTSGFDELHFKDKSIPIRDDEFPFEEGLSIVENSLITRWKPGTRFAYSNVGYLVAGYLIEQYAGKGYNEFIQEDLLRKIEMDHSAIRLEEINTELLARSYDAKQRTLPYKHLFTRPSGSLISSSQDMARFLMALLKKRTELLRPEFFDEFESHHSIDAFEGTENGCRLGLYPRFRSDRKWFGHGGSINQFNAEFEYCRSLDLGIFVVSNGPQASKTVDAIVSAFHQSILVTPQEKQKEHFDHPATDLQNLKGIYVLSSPRNQLQHPFSTLFSEALAVDVNDDQLTIGTIVGTKARLFESGEKQFSYTESGTGYQVLFEDKDDRTTLFSSLGFEYQKRSLLGFMLLLLSLLLSTLICFVSQFSLSVRLFRMIRRRTVRFCPQMTFELASTFFLLGCLVFLSLGLIVNIHLPQWSTVSLTVSSVIFPILTSIGLLQLSRIKLSSKLAKYWTICLALSCSFLSSYLIYWDFFGLTIWNY